MSLVPQSGSDESDAPKHRAPPRVLFVLAYPVAILLYLGILSIRLGGSAFALVWGALMFFPFGLSALFVWDDEVLVEHVEIALTFGWTVWLLVIVNGLIWPTYRMLAILGVVTVANIGGCNLDHALTWIEAAGQM